MLVLVELKLIQNKRIAFNRLCCGKTNGDLGFCRMVLYKMNNGMNTSVNCAVVVVLIAEILFQRTLLILCNMYCVLYQFVNALIFSRRNRDNRHAEHCFHPVNINRALIADNLIHHVQGNHHRHIHLKQLHSQIKISFNIGCIYDIYYRLGFVIENEVS